MRQVDLTAAQHLLNAFSSLFFWVKFLYDYGIRQYRPFGNLCYTCTVEMRTRKKYKSTRLSIVGPEEDRCPPIFGLPKALDRRQHNLVFVHKVRSVKITY